MLGLALYLHLAAALPTTCVVPPAHASEAEIVAMASRCTQDLRSERWQDFSPAEGVISALGARALDALLRCVAEEVRDDPRGRCVRSAGLLQVPAAYHALLATLERGEAGPSTLGALCEAMQTWGDPRALPSLARVLHGDEYPAHAAARAMYEIDPTYYRKLSEPQQLSYAMGISDSLSFQRDRLAGLSVHAPALAALLVGRLRTRELSLAGKPIYPGRMLLLLKQLGGQNYAADVLAFGEAVTDDATRASVLDLLREWGNPLGRDLAAATLRTALREGRAGHLLGVPAAARYLRKLAGQNQPGVAELLGTLWQESANSAALRCELVYGAAALRPRPPAVEVAQLLDGPCEHDLTILLNTPERDFIADLIRYLQQPKAQRPQSDAAMRALAWQCAARLHRAVCQSAAPFLRGVRRPSHPD